MAWTIEFERSANRDLAKHNHLTFKRILAFFRDRIAPLDDQHMIGDPLKGKKFGDYWRYRVGDYRVIALIDDRNVRILRREDREPSRCVSVAVMTERPHPLAAAGSINAVLDRHDCSCG